METSQSGSVEMHNKRIKFASVGRPTRKERCSLLAAYARRSAS